MRFTFEKERFFRRLAFVILIVVTALFQHTRGVMPQIGAARAWLLVPLVASISLRETNVAAMLLGTLAGLLWDFASPSMDGYYAILFCILSFVTGTLASFFLRRNFTACLLVTAVWLVLTGVMHWAFFIALGGMDHAVRILLRLELASCVYTFCFTPLYYFIVSGMDGLFRREQKPI
ncbi:MAG: rod shape-determining protein MreD [Clostridia bacterium]|nr:rod shape-determining protein MreD [Clostridia bacterium]